ncbi:hypothetical protein DVR12_20365 [Chitinophaga silvatica]|uniref:Guanylate cyclase domain-containing protein n=1 Tax=Chitinophaga silvatica TaxID=2282649 RepID=A0A3E1Y5R4_9BACT|nr:adenylate/guanylate cyclase domain-containing protein [Chitinophaga silvatica]RFS20076.1 hypothetical protein DVR12_20365 [Chitinophaga silvatica]
MGLKSIMSEIEEDVNDITNTDFVYNDTETVPPSDDSGLSYEKNKEKKGKELTSCVLYVDIRNSVLLTEKHSSKVMGKIYTAFTKGVIKAARHHGGHTRNIIGDRVMIVFPQEKCFTNAIRCAISINHVAKIINEKFKGVDFKCGIGIDHGKMQITKVGVPRKGKENQPNRGLVWAGIPANIASRLTDMGNKKITRTMYELNVKSILSDYFSQSQPYRLNTPTGKYQFPASTYLYQPKPLSVTESEFLSGVKIENGISFFRSRQVISLKKNVEEYTYPAILLTEQVYKGLINEGLEPNLYLPGDWTEQKLAIRNVKGKVYGGSYTWKL